MSLQTLGYIGLRTKSLEDWTAYASRFLGMQLVDKSRGTATFRMDDRKQRLVVQRIRRRRARASTAGRSPTPRRSTPIARQSGAPQGVRSRAARARLPRSARSAT